MKPSSIFAFVILPLLTFVCAQSPIVSTSATTFITLASGRVLTTVTSNVLLTITPTSSPQTTPSGASSGSGSVQISGSSPSRSGNSTSSSSSSSSTSTSPLPTAPTNVDGGGQNGATGGAPVPGQSAPGGVYGPNDGYISSEIVLRANHIVAILAGAALGGALVLA